jgi:hypothetical protein
MAREATSTRALRESYRQFDPLRTPVVNAIAVTTSLAIEEAVTMHRSSFLALLNVVRGALRGATGHGEDPNEGTRGVVVGVIRGGCFAGAEATSVFADVAEAVLKATSEMEGDLEVAAHGLIEGAAEAAGAIEVDEASAVSAAACGALETIEEFGDDDRLRVYRVLAEAVAGTRGLPSAPYYGWRSHRRGLRGNVSRTL